MWLQEGSYEFKESIFRLNNLTQDIHFLCHQATHLALTTIANVIRNVCCVIISVTFGLSIHKKNPARCLNMLMLFSLWLMSCLSICDKIFWHWKIVNIREHESVWCRETNKKLRIFWIRIIFSCYEWDTLHGTRYIMML